MARSSAPAFRPSSSEAISSPTLCERRCSLATASPRPHERISSKAGAPDLTPSRRLAFECGSGGCSAGRSVTATHHWGGCYETPGAEAAARGAICRRSARNGRSMAQYQHHHFPKQDRSLAEAGQAAAGAADRRTYSRPTRRRGPAQPRFDNGAATADEASQRRRQRCGRVRQPSSWRRPVPTPVPA